MSGLVGNPEDRSSHNEDSDFEGRSLIQFVLVPVPHPQYFPFPFQELDCMQVSRVSMTFHLTCVYIHVVLVRFRLLCGNLFWKIAAHSVDHNYVLFVC